MNLPGLMELESPFFLMTKPPISRPVLRINLFRRPPTQLRVDVTYAACRPSYSKATLLNG